MSETKMSCEELRAFYNQITESPDFLVYITLQEKIQETCNSFSTVKIDISSEDVTFKNLLAFSKQAISTLKDMREIWNALDAESKAKLKEQQKAAGEGSLGQKK
jgi:hypothetical protein